MTKRTWVLGGGGARGAAQVGSLLALFEAGVDPPDRVVGTSVGALNGAAICAYPSLAGAQMLRELWFTKQAEAVFTLHPVGMLVSRLRHRTSPLVESPVRRLVERALSITGKESFEALRVPLIAVATDVSSGRPALFRAGALEPALLASAAIPGVFPPVTIQERDYLDGGIVENTALAVAVEAGAKRVVAVDLMGGAEEERAPTHLGSIIALTLQLSLHHQMLGDYERLRRRADITVLCPVTPPTATWQMRRTHVEDVIERSRRATAALLAQRGGELFRHSGVHYIELAA
jgi:NTE family protein